MAFNLSSGLKKALTSKPQNIEVTVNEATISFGDGDGVGGRDTINNTATSFGVFAKHDWILICGGGANHNILVKALDVTTTKIEVMAGTLTAVGAGSNVNIMKLKGLGTLKAIFANSNMDIFTTTRPASADLVEAGTLLLSVTKDAAAFTGGASLNGLNLDADALGTTLNRAIDPETGVMENWQASGATNGTAGWGRWYANEKITGASTDAIRMDGLVGLVNSDIVMSTGTSVVTGAISNVTGVELSVEGV
jgi:hypothetical protein